MESAAEQLVRAWLKRHQRSITALPDARRVAYEPVKREARDAELTDLVAAAVRDSATHWDLHLLAAEDGTYPCTLKGWEADVIRRELADTDLVGWYRNPTGGPGALPIPYQGEQRDRAMYPDFVLFHQSDDGVRPSIVDPHGYHLADAAAKLRGLAAYAASHAEHYLRIDAVAKVDDQLLALDLRSAAVRDAVQAEADSGVEQLFRQHGGKYS